MSLILFVLFKMDTKITIYLVATVFTIQFRYGNEKNISSLIMQCKENTEISAYCKPIKTDTYIH